MFKGSGFIGVGFIGFRAWGLGFRVHVVQGLGFTGLRVLGLGFITLLITSCKYCLLPISVMYGVHLEWNEVYGLGLGSRVPGLGYIRPKIAGLLSEERLAVRECRRNTLQQTNVDIEPFLSRAAAFTGTFRLFHVSLGEGTPSPHDSM